MLDRNQDRIEVSIPGGPDLVIESVKGDIPPTDFDKMHVDLGARDLRSHLEGKYPKFSRLIPQKLLTAFVRFQDRKVLPSVLLKKAQPYLDSQPGNPEEKTMIRITGRPPVES